MSVGLFRVHGVGWAEDPRSPLLAVASRPLKYPNLAIIGVEYGDDRVKIQPANLVIPESS